MTALTAQLVADYGYDVTTAAGATRHLRAIEPLRVPNSEQSYVGIARSLIRRRGDDPWATDARLIAALYGLIPVGSWRYREGRAAAWLAYWASVAERAEIVGSEYNPTPRTLARVWRLGLPVEVGRTVPVSQYDASVIPTTWRGHRWRILALMRLWRRGTTAPPWRTADLRRLSRISGAALRALDAAHAIDHERPDWQRIADALRVYRQVPRRAARMCGVPAKRWLLCAPFGSSLAAVVPAESERWCALAAAIDGGMPARLVRRASAEAARGNPAQAGAIIAVHDRGWSQRLGALDPAEDLVGVVGRAASDGVILPPVAWSSRAQLVEALEAAGYSCDYYGSTTPSADAGDVRAAHNAVCRRADRRAQRDPEWAIAGWRAEYERGRRIAPLLSAALDDLRETVREHVAICHGRDCELLYQLALRAGVQRDRLRYAITSRPITTQSSDIPDAYREYLDRLVVDGVHYDTGFSGSIPRWIESKNLAQVHAIRLMSSEYDAHRISLPAGWTADRARAVVLEDVEHAPQRLERPDAWGRLMYSASAPGFWSRLYGVCDVLGVNRVAS